MSESTSSTSSSNPVASLSDDRPQSTESLSTESLATESQSTESLATESQSTESLAPSLANRCGDQQEDFQQLLDEVGGAVADYCRRRPGVAACTLFAVGFFFGWKIKPW